MYEQINFIIIIITKIKVHLLNFMHFTNIINVWNK
jgi:hypothetical protein